MCNYSQSLANMEKILILGAGGQLGKELATALSKVFGNQNIILSDLKPIESSEFVTETIDVLNADQIIQVIKKHQITQIYHLAALLSAIGEKNPSLAWNINMNGLIHVLDISVDLGIKQVFWPSSIAAFGPNTPRVNTPQYCVMDPNTMYGITKLTGERLCEYYFFKKGLDVRSLRYPGIISYSSPPGGGTTDYAIHIFYEALKYQKYTCFLSENTELPMIYMPDAIRATLELMQAPKDAIKIRSSYNLAGFSFTPKQIAQEIQKHIPNFQISYAPDFRQAIADSWPQSIDDSAARKDWNWIPHFQLPEMVKDMLDNIQKTL